MVHYAVIADDLSGSSDTAVTFSNYGHKSCVINFPEGMGYKLDSCDILSVSTNSREIAPEKAKNIVEEACRYLKKIGVNEVYKKIDSTWRGHIGIELETVLEELDLTFAIICPAYPQMGRTVKNGTLLINGIPINQTAIADDPGFPVKDSYLPDMLKKQTGLPVKTVCHDIISRGSSFLTKHIKELAGRGKTLIVIDALNDTDLDSIANIDKSQLPPFIFCGSAGLSGAILRNGNITIPSTPSVYVVVGSVNPQNDAMVEYLLRNGLAKEVYLDPVDLMEGTEHCSAMIPNIETLIGGGDLVLRTCRDGQDRDKVKKKSQEKGYSELEAAEAIAQGLQCVMGMLCRRNPISGLIITGGATALHVIRGLEGVGVELEEELETGIPFGRIIGGPLHGLGIVTKAGGFGSEKTFAKCIQILKKKFMLERNRI